MDASAYVSFARRWWWLLLTGTLLAVAAYGIAARIRDRHHEPPVFTATSTLFVSLPPRIDAPSGQTTVDRPWDLDRLIATYAAMLKGDNVASRTAADLGIDNPATDIRNRIATQITGGTQLIDVTTRAASPADAETLTAAVVRAFSAVRREQALPGDASLYESSPARLVVQSRNSDLLNVLIVAMAGFAAAAGIVFAFEYLSDSVRDARDVESASGVPILAIVPRWKAAKNGIHALAINVERNSAALERYRTLRTNARLAAKDESAEVIVVAGAVGGDGATTTAANFAVSLAQAGRNVVLVDANLRTPALSEAFGVEPSATGLADALTSDLPLGRVVRPTRIHGLSFVAAGAVRPYPSELLESHRFDALLEGLRVRFDAVVIDASPLLEATDAAIVAAQADAAIVVVRCDRTTRADTTAAVETLRRTGVRVLGIVLNAEGGRVRRAPATAAVVTSIEGARERAA